MSHPTGTCPRRAARGLSNNGREARRLDRSAESESNFWLVESRDDALAHKLGESIELIPGNEAFDKRHKVKRRRSGRHLQSHERQNKTRNPKGCHQEIQIIRNKEQTPSLT
jgi:hypothetical protein